MSTSSLAAADEDEKRPRARDVGVVVGELPTGPLNAITDVSGVKVGHKTLIAGDDIRTGVTVIVPGPDSLFANKMPAAVYVGNGFGKMAGSTQIEELGTLETPIVLTNTLSVSTGLEALIRHTLALPGHEEVRSVNAVVGETNDGTLNNIRKLAVTTQDVFDALTDASSGPVAEGNVGAGTGTIAFSYKGGIGTSSRVIEIEMGQYSVGVLVQANYGRRLLINGVPFYIPAETDNSTTPGDGSCMIIVATDAPLDVRNLKRLAKRSMLGLARTGSNMSNGSGDYAISFSTAYRIAHRAPNGDTMPPLVPNSRMSPLFQAVVEATQEAVYNALFAAETMRGFDGNTVEAISIERVVEKLRAHDLLEE